MGANASTESGLGSAGSGQRKPGAPLDHYEVLGISTESTSDEIKKAFRKAALREHPDKNPHDIQGSTKRFAIIQAAYEVLSDEQERAWYDDHREQILNDGQAKEGPQDLAAEAFYFDSLRRGGTSVPKPRSASTRGVTIPQLMKFFTTSSWSGFDESATGFYTTFRTLFALIASEENALRSTYTYPTFGTKESDYESVVKKFYTGWLDFATEKEFGWLDQYKLEDGMERRMKRAIEQENKRLRQGGRREYNETVRNLVLYVRRRDPRWQAGQSTLSPEAQRAAELAKIRADLLLAAKERALENGQLAAQYQAQDWQKGNDEVFKQWEERSEGDEGSEEGENEDEQWCVACGKGFMSGGAWENHERSRKHQKNLERLIKEMQEEDEALGLGRAEEAGQENVGEEEDLDDDEGEDGDSPPIASTSRSPSPTSSLAEDVAAFNLASTNDPEADGEVPLPTKTKKKKRRKVATATSMDEIILDEPDLDTLGIAKKSKKGKKKGQSGISTPFQMDAVSDLEEYEALGKQVKEVLLPSGGKTQEGRRGRGKGKEAKGSGSSTPAEGGGMSTPTESRGAKEDLELAMAEEAEMSKKDKRRLKEAAKKAGTGTEEKCHVCSVAFPSRTKLFDHIKVTGHALAEGPAPTGKTSSKKNKR
ncbi:hypothetical protein MVLG_02517 [Microbotryum lychnidis-dioicae p1A1 Lamole]|uniref:J domain-containing protein n=1 Tax=Microbotryum lychnidis-dioicae (strain p1A1 Lamole / MvSl-1064) TaxID=683840 RepID=U5H5E2_USTV1|nr:hypothetical protein MVLG_02517 [Microbotryum lychnidis-dioicae p1A1 Lamole]|eukprot:KDE07297.1 hypothetical protein MVLG_02517 [Microbotryum lychnidis-dioicae p1A1 Lamole]